MGGDTLVLLRTATDVARTMSHEMSHLVVGQAARSPYGGLPVWLDEGLAEAAPTAIADHPGGGNRRGRCICGRRDRSPDSCW